jgi:hypothetical protein
VQVYYYPDSKAFKVFGLGLSRTGTTSLNRALQLLDLRVYHWRFPLSGNLLMLEDAYLCDGITDINAAFMMEPLFHMFPNARFVYTTRPVDQWVAAVSHHYNAASPKQLAQRLSWDAVTPSPVVYGGERNCLLYHAIHHGLYTGHDSWEDAYRNHEERVRRCFSGAEERLLVLDLFDGEASWEALCHFLGKQAPLDTPFPHETWRRADS